MNGGGDSLARGMKSAKFGPANVTQEKWDAIWSDDSETITTCYTVPLHVGNHVEVPEGVKVSYYKK